MLWSLLLFLSVFPILSQAAMNRGFQLQTLLPEGSSMAHALGCINLIKPDCSPPYANCHIGNLVLYHTHVCAVGALCQKLDIYDG